MRLRSILFFTFGGSKASDILEDIDRQCRELFPGYEKTVLVFFEGCFTCAEVSTPLSVRLTGTDLLRWHATMAPEFVESQYSDPAYPLERCTIYDAGSRAFWLKDYVEDVIGYWRQNLQFAEHGMTFRQLLEERFPSLDPDRFPADTDLKKLAVRQIEMMERML